MAPGGFPGPPQERKRKWYPFLLLFFPSWAALGRSWGAPGGSWGRLGASWGAPGRSRRDPGGYFGLPGVSFWSFLGLFFTPAWKIAKTLKTLVFSMVFHGFCLPGGSKIAPKWLRNRSCPRLGNLLALTWRFSALSWRLLAASWRSWGLLGDSSAEKVLKRKTWLS